MTEGEGKLWFGGVDITQAPYYAGLAYETKYWFLDGFDSTQFPTSPLSLVSTLPYLKDWLISDVIRVESPDNTRATLIKAITALSGVFDPTKGEQQLIHAEYAGSYFMAKRQTSSLSNETAFPYMVDINIDWACTGPAYSLIEQDIITTLTQRQNTLFTLRSNGDSQASPLWRFYAGGVVGRVRAGVYTHKHDDRGVDKLERCA